MKNKIISAFADEIASDLRMQLLALQKLGISYITLRHVSNKNIVDYTLDEVQQIIVPLLKQYKIKVSSISSPIGKVDIHNEKAVKNQFDKMKNIVAICEELDIPYIRVFSYYNTSKEDKELVVKYIKKMLTYVKGTTITLLHENEKEIYGDTADKCLYLLQEVNDEKFQAIYDPANFVQVNEDPLKAYETVKDYVKYVHLKDATLKNEENVLLGTGDAKIPILLQKVADNPQITTITFEPHLVEFEGFWDLETSRDLNVKDVPSYEKSFAKFHETYQTFKQLLLEINE